MTLLIWKHEAPSHFVRRRFDPARRIEVQLSGLLSELPNELFCEGEAYEEELGRLKAQQGKARLAEQQPSARKRKAAGSSPKDRDDGESDS